MRAKNRNGKPTHFTRSVKTTLGEPFGLPGFDTSTRTISRLCAIATYTKRFSVLSKINPLTAFPIAFANRAYGGRERENGAPFGVGAEAGPRAVRPTPKRAICASGRDAGSRRYAGRPSWGTGPNDCR